ncbi:Sulfate Permease (SulP) Family [Achlya hypogyna]|uniref:Sulfate Permease (SulP) Family n=1 Tax=Achlya hypogyna TaxID=1202772 RepID=A0A1V9ZNC3_ACHHY|nr:Sulfate Permease (SulP) Family [Achlya hypogyna]
MAWTRVCPLLHWLPRYDVRRDLKFDVIAGITVAMMIVPQEISLANVMNVPAQYGLYTAALTPALYTVFGTSRVLSVANGAEVSLMVGTYLQTLPAKDERIAVGILLSFLIGAINFLLGCLRLGVIADFFSRPVMGGFLSGGGVLIMISQLPTWLQLKLPTSSYPLQTLYEVCRHAGDINWNSFGVGLASILVLSIFKYIKAHWVAAPQLTELLESPHAFQPLRPDPAPLGTHRSWGFSLTESDFANMEKVHGDAVETAPRPTSTTARLVISFVLKTALDLGPLFICGFGIVAGYLLGEARVKVTGHVPQGLPSPVLPWYGYNEGLVSTDNFGSILLQAVTIAVIVYSTSIAMAKRLAVRGNYDIDANQELLALGFASAFGAFFQAMPPTGGMSRTAVNVQSARTQLASFVTVFLVILVLLFLTNALYYLPKASLAAIIIVAGYWLIEIDEAKWLYGAKRDEFYVWVLSFALTIGLGILPGLFSSIGCSLLAVMIKTKRPDVYLLGEMDDGQLVDRNVHPELGAVPLDALVIRVEGSMYFGNAEYVAQFVLAQVVLFPGRRFVVLDASYLYDVDATALQVLDTVRDRLGALQVHFAFAGARGRVGDTLGPASTLPPGVVLAQLRSP